MTLSDFNVQDYAKSVDRIVGQKIGILKEGISTSEGML